MKLTRVILYNTLTQFAGRLVTAGLFFVTTVWLARYLGPQYFGEFIKITSYLAIFSVLVDFGLNQVFLHFKTEKTVEHSLPFILLRMGWGVSLSIIAVLVMWTLTRTQANFHQPVFLGVIVGTISLMAASIQLAATALFQWGRRLDMSALVQVIGAAVTLFVVMISTHLLPRSSEQLTIAAVFSYGLGATTAALIGVLLALKLRHLKITQLPSREFVQVLFKRSLPLGLTLVLNSLYLRVGVLVMSTTRSAAEVGAYGLAYKFFEFGLVLPTFIMSSYYPDLVALEKSKQAPGELKGALLTLLYLSFAFGAGLWLSAPFLPLIRLDFQSSVDILRALALALPIFFLTSPLMWFFVVKKAQKYLLWIYLVATILNICCTIWLVPWRGGIGAVWAIGLSELLVLVVGWVVYYKHIR